MRQLIPAPDPDVDPVRAYLAADRPAPGGRPWVTVGMIQSLDGATAIDGTSGALGGEADKAVFRAVRAVADVVLVAGGTARAEDYGPVRLSAEVRAARRDAGRRDVEPRLAVVSGSLDLDPDGRLFAHDGPRPIVFTGAESDQDRRTRLSAVADVRVVGRRRADPAELLASLAADGVDVVVCEGGPSLNGALTEADLVDEWCVTLAPTVAGGDSARIASGAAPASRSLRLDSLLESDGMLFGRWLRVR